MENNIKITPEDVKYIKMACELASDNIDKGGGPFGAVIVKNGEECQLQAFARVGEGCETGYRL